ncbi:hypothetical protein AZI86_15300 [Bdellovibrio bacteriovorus]|uniref:Protein containing CheY-like receiver n=1 Tax=Bdellovibrio bacteriovorus TaxID=959 RepID=A0A150WHK1_BDEBC|nr:hypothetical protein [Bdellovibrio bacteriovorus]KYG63084.1 hypothetical protein AZI86_15300 [Bdellovibrio bacteriovorus]
MNKILLVYEDYADLMNVESTLKKVGFDVIGLTNEYTVAEQVLAFNPDLVVGSGRGGKVNSLGVGKRLKEMHRWQGKSVLIFPAKFKPEPQDLIRIRVDMMLEAPVPALRLIQVIGKLLNHDEAVLLERLNKNSTTESEKKASSSATSVGGKFNLESEAIYIKGRTEEVDKNSEERSMRSEKIGSEDGVNFSFDNQEPEEKRKVSFKFGDRMSDAASGGARKTTDEKSSSLFADVDLKALEKELLGGGTPEMERIEPQELEKPVVPEAPAELRASAEGEFEPAAGITEPPESLEDVSVNDMTLEDLIDGEVVRGGPPESIDSAVVTSEARELKDLQAKAQRELASAEKALKNRMEKYAALVADVKVAPKSTVSRVEARRRQKQMAAEWDAENLNELDKLRREFTKALFKK